MRMGQGVGTGLGHGGITCVLQTQFSSYYYYYYLSPLPLFKQHEDMETQGLLSILVVVAG